MADRLAKEAARSDGTNYGFSRIPKSTIYHEAAEEAIQKWQEQWTKSPKAEATKQYFPTVMDRIGIKINLTPKLTAVLSGHGKTCTDSTYGKTRNAYATKTTKQWTIYYSTVQRLVHKETF